MDNIVASQTKSNRRKLLVVLLIFALPVVLSTMLYVSGWRPSSTGNYGELIQPPRFIEEISFQSIDGKIVKFSDLHGKWTMIYFDSALCPAECMDRIYFMRQTHRSQGKYLDKIQRVFVLTDNQGVNNLNAKLAGYPEMRVLTTEKESLSKLYKQFGLQTQADVAQRNIFLIDQQGNLMMRYKSSSDPAGVRKDFDRLLKYSAEN
jgi:cytochrome oxidase Cu insertion factor (SCO1/SenC/PrrC family)